MARASVVVGNGMAGLQLGRGARAPRAGRYDIAVVGAEPEPAYNRVLLSSLLAGEIERCRRRSCGRATGTRSTASRF